ncbi:hypothetical protein ScPMuIL_001863 [Solemya velum]
MFQGLLTNIERRLQIFPYVESGRSNVRTLGSLEAENFFGEFQDLDPKGSGVIEAEEVPAALETACQMNQTRLMPNSPFHMSLSKAKVYPVHDLITERDMDTDEHYIYPVSPSYINLRNHEFDIESRAKRKARRKLTTIAGPGEAARGKRQSDSTTSVTRPTQQLETAKHNVHVGIGNITYEYTWKLETFDENGNGVIDVTNYVLADSKLKKLFFKIETKDELPDINMEPRLLIYENVDFDMFKEKLSRSRRDKRSRIFPTKNIGDLFISRSRFKRRERDKRTADENIVEHRQDTHLETTQIVTESSLTPGTTADSVTLPVHPNVSDTNNSETRSTTSMTSIETTPKRYHCFRHLWEFDFRVIAWNRIIIQPTSFDAGYCKGACTTPFVHRRINSTMYSFLKNLYHKSTEFKDTTVPRAVCTPISYYPQTVQYITETGEFRTKTLLEMRVAACGCR